MTDLFSKARDWKEVRQATALGLYPYFRAFGPSLELNGKPMLMAGSNNYLGLADDARVKEAAIRAVEQYGSTCSGSRLLNGTRDLHQQLERALADFLGTEAAVCVSTGFQTNLAALTGILGRHDTVFTDKRNHASLVDGVQLSRAKERRYAHQDMEQLEQLLEADRGGGAKLIVTDAVFSMEGDLCNLPRLVELARAHRARLLIDDAHGVGVLGAGGRGTAEYFGLTVDLLTGTFSKSLASLGGYVAGPAEVIDYIKHHARAVVFSASMTPAAAAAALAALQIVQAEPERRARVFDNAQRLHDGLRALGFDTGVSVTPVVPVLVGEQTACLEFYRDLIAAGVYCNPVISPAVSPGQALLRCCAMATHTGAQLDRLIESFAKIGRRLKLIPATPPATFVPAQLARPMANVFSGPSSERWEAAASGRLADRRPSMLKLSALALRGLTARITEAVARAY